ncbi:unnamed protein product [Brassica oleracea]
MDYPRNMFYVVHDVQMKRNMVLFTLLFAILIKFTNLPKCLYIFSCRDQCMSEKHRMFLHY